MSLNYAFIGISNPEQVEWTKLSRKVLYHFAIFTMINEILIIKNR